MLSCGAASLTTPLPASASPNRASSASFMRTSYSASGSSVGQPGEAASSGRWITHSPGRAMPARLSDAELRLSLTHRGVHLVAH